MKEELKAIEKNGTWELVDLPTGKKPVAVKWVYKIKRKPDGTISKFKARLAAKGFQQRHDFDYTEVFAHVARMEKVRLVVAAAASSNWTLHQLHVKSTF